MSEMISSKPEQHELPDGGWAFENVTDIYRGVINE